MVVAQLFLFVYGTGIRSLSTLLRGMWGPDAVKMKSGTVLLEPAFLRCNIYYLRPFPLCLLFVFPFSSSTFLHYFPDNCTYCIPFPIHGHYCSAFLACIAPLTTPPFAYEDSVACVVLALSIPPDIFRQFHSF